MTADSKNENTFDMVMGFAEDRRWTNDTIITLLCIFIGDRKELKSELNSYLCGVIEEEDSVEPEDEETIFTEKPNSCNTCWREDYLTYNNVDTNGRPSTGWLCNNCGRFHLERFKDTEVTD